LRGDKAEPSQIQAVAGKDFVQHALWLIPWNAQTPCMREEQHHLKATSVQYAFGGQTETCWVPAKKTSCKAHGEDDEDIVLAPYWAVDFAKAEEKPNMDLKPVTIKFGKLGDVTGIGANALKMCVLSGADANGVLTIYALTNTRKVKAGEILLRKQK
jgi:hypothetical protein